MGDADAAVVCGVLGFGLPVLASPARWQMCCAHFCVWRASSTWLVPSLITDGDRHLHALVNSAFPLGKCLVLPFALFLLGCRSNFLLVVDLCTSGIPAFCQFAGCKELPLPCGLSPPFSLVAVSDRKI